MQYSRVAPMSASRKLCQFSEPWAADIHLSPDGRTLYASERTSSTPSTFRVDAATGQLQPLGQVPTEKTRAVLRWTHRVAY